MDLTNPSIVFWKICFPPFFYGLHGWLATKMAIIALFRPYQEWFFPLTRVRVPCTPGIFPKRQAKLAQAVASTITDTLLTPADIRSQVEHLVTEKNIHIAINLFFDTLLKEFRDTAKLHRLAHDVAELSPSMLQALVVSIVDGIGEHKNRQVAAMVEKIFDQVILTARIPQDQADEIAGRVMDNILTPARIRAGLARILSSQNINSVDESIQAHASTPYKLLARIIGVKRILWEWRNYLEKEPEESQRIVADLAKRFGLKEQIAMEIANFDLRSMPLQNIADLKGSLAAFVEEFLLIHRDDILEAVKRIEEEAMGTVKAAIIRFNPESIPERWLERAKYDVSNFCYLYLQRELGEMLEKAIPSLGMYALIERKIHLFTPMQLERVIQRICKQELFALEILGGVIGVGCGLIQIAVNFIGP